MSPKERCSNYPQCGYCGSGAQRLLRWILRLFCAFGLHAWKVDSVWDGEVLLECNDCGLQRWR